MVECEFVCLAAMRSDCLCLDDSMDLIGVSFAAQKVSWRGAAMTLSPTLSDTSLLGGTDADTQYEDGTLPSPC